MHTEELIRQLRAPDQRNMGRVEGVENGIGNIDRLAQLDKTALTIRVWDSAIIPGNLQTSDYSAAVIRAAHPHMGKLEITRRVLLKEARARSFRTRLHRDALGPARFVIGERAITQCFQLDFDAQAVQLRHVLTLAANEEIIVQVLPDSTITPGLAGQFALYGLDAPHRVGYIETIMGSWYSTRLDDVAKLHSTFSDISAAAMSPTSTRAFIREALTSWQFAKKESTDSTGEPPSSSRPTPHRAMTALESPEQARADWHTEL